MKKFIPVIKKQLVLAIQKIEVEKPIYVQFMTAIKVKDKVEKDGAGVETKGEIHIGHVLNLETGEELHVVMGSVLLSTLTEEYADDSYVGKGFMITKQAKRGTGARGYHPYLLAELDLGDEKPEDDQEVAEQATKKTNRSG